MLEGARRHRETFAWALVGFVAVKVLVELIRLFTGQGFTTNAVVSHVEFVSPVVAGALALAVWLVAAGREPTPRARSVVAAALGVAGAALFVGTVAWLGGLTVNSFVQSTGQKVSGSLLFLAGAGLLGAAAWFGWLVLERLPVRVHPPAWANQDWAQGGWQQPGWSQPGWSQSGWSQSGWDARHGQSQHWPTQPHYDQPHYDQPHYDQPERTGFAQTDGGHVRDDGPPWTAPATGAEPTLGLSIFDDPADARDDRSGAGAPTDGDDAASGGDDVASPDDNRVDEGGALRDGWPPRSF